MKENLAEENSKEEKSNPKKKVEDKTKTLAKAMEKKKVKWQKIAE